MAHRRVMRASRVDSGSKESDRGRRGNRSGSGIFLTGVDSGVVDPGPIGRAAVDGSATFDSATGPPLVPQQDGHLWIAPTCDGTLAADRLWEMLSDARTFRH